MNKTISLENLQRLVIAPLKKLIDKKVDKVDGKDLSTNDYTTADKEKLAGIEAGAQVNVQSDWNQANTSAEDYIKNKPTIPSISGLATESYVNGQVVQIEKTYAKISELDDLKARVAELESILNSNNYLITNG